MTYDTRTHSFVVPEESMRLAEIQLKAAIRQQRQLSTQVPGDQQQACILAEESILKALEYIGLYSGQHKPAIRFPGLIRADVTCITKTE